MVTIFITERYRGTREREEKLLITDLCGGGGRCFWQSVESFPLFRRQSWLHLSGTPRGALHFCVSLVSGGGAQGHAYHPTPCPAPLKGRQKSHQKKGKEEELLQRQSAFFSISPVSGVGSPPTFLGCGLALPSPGGKDLSQDQGLQGRRGAGREEVGFPGQGL